MEKLLENKTDKEISCCVKFRNFTRNTFNTGIF